MTATRRRAFAPGRVNVIGEHTDYNGGLALPFAIGLGVTVTVTALGDDRVEAVAEERPFGRDWRPYVDGMVAALGARAVRIEIAGDVPPDAGLASSAALCVALALALGAAGPPVEIARLCSRVEREWAGRPTGLLDQLAALHGREGHAVRLDFTTLDARAVPLRLDGWRFVTVDSGEPHGPGYAERRRECEEAARRLGVATVSQAAGWDGLPAPLDRRVRHVLEENARVDAAVRALERGDLAALGRLLDASHASLRDFYEASTEAVEAAVARLREAGAAGARMVGGGFGGHVLALFGPDAHPPDDAIAVAPSGGARLTG